MSVNKYCEAAVLGGICFNGYNNHFNWHINYRRAGASKIIADVGKLFISLSASRSPL